MVGSVCTGEVIITKLSPSLSADCVFTAFGRCPRPSSQVDLSRCLQMAAWLRSNMHAQTQKSGRPGDPRAIQWSLRSTFFMSQVCDEEAKEIGPDSSEDEHWGRVLQGMSAVSAVGEKESPWQSFPGPRFPG